MRCRTPHPARTMNMNWTCTQLHRAMLSFNMYKVTSVMEMRILVLFGANCVIPLGNIFYSFYGLCSEFSHLDEGQKIVLLFGNFLPFSLGREGFRSLGVGNCNPRSIILQNRIFPQWLPLGTTVHMVGCTGWVGEAYPPPRFVFSGGRSKLGNILRVKVLGEDFHALQR